MSCGAAFRPTPSSPTATAGYSPNRSGSWRSITTARTTSPDRSRFRPAPGMASDLCICLGCKGTGFGGRYRGAVRREQRQSDRRVPARRRRELDELLTVLPAVDRSPDEPATLRAVLGLPVPGPAAAGRVVFPPNQPPRGVPCLTVPHQPSRPRDTQCQRSRRGHHHDAWRSADLHPLSFVDTEYFTEVGRIAERGTLDGYFRRRPRACGRIRGTNPAGHSNPPRSWARSPPPPSTSASSAPCRPPSTTGGTRLPDRVAGLCVRRAGGVECGHHLRRGHRRKLRAPPNYPTATPVIVAPGFVDAVNELWASARNRTPVRFDGEFFTIWDNTRSPLRARPATAGTRPAAHRRAANSPDARRTRCSPPN